MIIWSLLWLLLIGKCSKGETANQYQSQNLQPVEGGANDKADTLVKAKFNFTTNGCFSGEFGKFANAVAEAAAAVHPEKRTLAGGGGGEQSKELIKELISNLLIGNTKCSNKYAKRYSGDETVGFKPKVDAQSIPIRVPSVFDHTDKCIFRSVGCWCREEAITVPCTWETDCFCATTVTCGPTKPCPEHRDKWCFILTPNVFEYRTHAPCKIMTTVPYCTTTMHTPCASFTPPCVHPTPYTLEPCVCPTNNPCTCPCPPARLHPDLLSLLFKRASLLPDPLRNRTIALLRNRRFCKRLLKGIK